MTGPAVSRWRLIAKVLLFFVAAAVVLAVTSPVASRFAGKRVELVLGVLTMGLTFVLTVLFARWERLRLRNVGAAVGPGSLRRFFTGLGLGLALVALWAAISIAFGEVSLVRGAGPGVAQLPVALMSYLALAGREELAFRGFPLRRLHAGFGTWAAQLTVALVFAAEHRLGGTPWAQALLGPGVGSLLFGMLALTSRGLALPIGAHAAWNFGHWMLGFKGESGVWRVLVPKGHEGRATVAGTIAYVAVIGAATVAVWWWHKRSQRADARADLAIPRKQ